MRDTITGMRNLPQGWDGDSAEPPNEIALNGALRVLAVLQKMDFRPNRVAPSAEGGVTFSFFIGNLYGDIEIFNTGAMLVATSDSTGQPQIWEVADDETAITDALARIRATLNRSETDWTAFTGTSSVTKQ
jgi:hypothetical protein